MSTRKQFMYSKMKWNKRGGRMESTNWNYPVQKSFPRWKTSSYCGWKTTSEPLKMNCNTTQNRGKIGHFTPRFAREDVFSSNKSHFNRRVSKWQPSETFKLSDQFNPSKSFLHPEVEPLNCSRALENSDNRIVYYDASSSKVSHCQNVSTSDLREGRNDSIREDVKNLTKIKHDKLTPENCSTAAVKEIKSLIDKKMERSFKDNEQDKNNSYDFHSQFLKLKKDFDSHSHSPHPPSLNCTQGGENENSRNSQQSSTPNTFQSSSKNSHLSQENVSCECVTHSNLPSEPAIHKSKSYHQDSSRKSPPFHNHSSYDQTSNVFNVFLTKIDNQHNYTLNVTNNVHLNLEEATDKNFKYEENESNFNDNSVKKTYSNRPRLSKFSHFQSNRKFGGSMSNTSRKIYQQNLQSSHPSYSSKKCNQQSYKFERERNQRRPSNRNQEVAWNSYSERYMNRNTSADRYYKLNWREETDLPDEERKDTGKNFSHSFNKDFSLKQFPTCNKKITFTDNSESNISSEVVFSCETIEQELSEINVRGDESSDFIRLKDSSQNNNSTTIQEQASFKVCDVEVKHKPQRTASDFDKKLPKNIPPVKNCTINTSESALSTRKRSLSSTDDSNEISSSLQSSSPCKLFKTIDEPMLISKPEETCTITLNSSEKRGKSVESSNLSCTLESKENECAKIKLTSSKTSSSCSENSKSKSNLSKHLIGTVNPPSKISSDATNCAKTLEVNLESESSQKHAKSSAQCFQTETGLNVQETISEEYIANNYINCATSKKACFKSKFKVDPKSLKFPPKNGKVSKTSSKSTLIVKDSGSIISSSNCCETKKKSKTTVKNKKNCQLFSDVNCINTSELNTTDNQQTTSEVHLIEGSNESTLKEVDNNISAPAASKVEEINQFFNEKEEDIFQDDDFVNELIGNSSEDTSCSGNVLKYLLNMNEVFNMSPEDIKLFKKIKRRLDDAYVPCDEQERLKRLNIDISWTVPVQHTLESSISNEIFNPRLLMEELKKMGLGFIEMKSDAFSEEEDLLLKRRWKTFCKVYGFKNPAYFITVSKLGGVLPKNERVKFTQYLGKDLPHRFLCTIFNRFTVLFGTWTKQKFTKEEDELLLRIKENNFIKYKNLVSSLMLNRKRLSILNRAYSLSTPSDILYDKEKQKWKGFRDDEKLVKFIMKKTNSKTLEELEKKTVPISVFESAARKLHLNFISAVGRWKFRLNTQLFATAPLFKYQICVKLINWFKSQNYSNWSDVCWQKACNEIYNCSKTFLTAVFRSIILKFDSYYRSYRYDFRNCVNYLWENALPYFEQKLIQDVNICRYRLNKNGFLFSIV